MLFRSGRQVANTKKRLLNRLRGARLGSGLASCNCGSEGVWSRTDLFLQRVMTATFPFSNPWKNPFGIFQPLEKDVGRFSGGGCRRTQEPLLQLHLLNSRVPCEAPREEGSIRVNSWSTSCSVVPLSSGSGVRPVRCAAQIRGRDSSAAGAASE